MSRFASSPNDHEPINKRLRSVLFDDAADRDDSDPPICAPVAATASPTAAAKAELEFLAETLPNEIRPVVLKHGSAMIKAYTALQAKQDKLQSMKDNDEFLPRSLRFKVSADVLPEVEKSHPNYKAKKEEFDAAVLKAGHDLKQHILGFTKMNCDGLRRRYHQTFAAAFKPIVELLLAFHNQEDYGADSLIAEFLKKNKLHFEATHKFSIQRFGHVYKDLFNTVLYDDAEGNAANVQQEGAAVAPETPANNGRAAAVSPDENTAADETMEDAPAERILGGRIVIEVHIHQWLSGLHRVIEKYEEQKEVAARQLRLKQVTARHEKTGQTKTVYRRLEEEGNVSPPTLTALVQRELKAAMKDKDAKIAELEKALAGKPKSILKSTVSPKNETGAATGGGAKQRNHPNRSTPHSTPKQRGKGQVAGESAVAIQSDASKRGRSRSTARQQQRRGKSKGRKSNGSGASRQN